MQSHAIEQLTAIHAERDRLVSIADELEAKAAPLRAQLAEHEQAQAADAQALADATTALAVALAAGSQDAITEARSRVAAASRASAKASAIKTEMEALKAALAALNEKSAPIGLRIHELHQREKLLTGQRLHEVAAEVGERYKAVMHTLADVVADAQALGITAMKLDLNVSFAPAPYALPSIVGENMGTSGRVVVDLAPLRQQAAAALVERLHVEGFMVV